MKVVSSSKDEDAKLATKTSSSKKTVSTISTLETKILNEDPDDLIDEGRVVLQGRGREVSDEDLQQQKSTERQ
jgi:protein SMG6